MSKQKTTAILAIFVTIFASTAMLAQSVFAATPKDAVCSGAGLVVDGTTGCTPAPGAATTPSIEDSVKTGLNIFSAIVGIIAVVMIIFAGLKYITSGGDAAKTASAQNTILYAVIGLAVAALAQVVVQFAIQTVAPAPNTPGYTCPGTGHVLKKGETC